MPPSHLIVLDPCLHPTPTRGMNPIPPPCWSSPNPPSLPQTALLLSKTLVQQLEGYFGWIFFIENDYINTKKHDLVESLATLHILLNQGGHINGQSVLGSASV